MRKETHEYLISIPGVRRYERPRDDFRMPGDVINDFIGKPCEALLWVRLQWLAQRAIHCPGETDSSEFRLSIGLTAIQLGFRRNRIEEAIAWLVATGRIEARRAPIRYWTREDYENARRELEAKLIGGRGADPA